MTPIFILIWLMKMTQVLALLIALVSWLSARSLEKALVADFAPSHLRGSAFGLYHLTVGIGALPASILFGLVWQYAGAEYAFGMGAALAPIASIMLLFVRARREA